MTAPNRYTARITRKTPTAFVFLLDMSGSMEERIRYEGAVMPKAEALAMAMNTMIGELLNRCRRETGYYDYFDIAVLGYCGDRIVDLLEEAAGACFCKPSELAARQVPVRSVQKERRLPDGQSVFVSVDQKQWIAPQAESTTPMFAALDRCHTLLQKWLSDHRSLACYPPTVINITDGEATDAGDEKILGMADKIRSLGTDDGQVLMFNIHLSSSEDERTISFPSAEDELPDIRYARLLHAMSSEMPAPYHDQIREMKENGFRPSYRCVSYNTSMSELIRLMNIGTVSVNQLR